KALPIADDTRRDVELATELRQRLLARQDPPDRRPFELRAEHPPPVSFPSVLAHGSSRRILRPQGEQSKRGALQAGAVYCWLSLRKSWKRVPRTEEVEEVNAFAGGRGEDHAHESLLLPPVLSVLLLRIWICARARVGLSHPPSTSARR